MAAVDGNSKPLLEHPKYETVRVVGSGTFGTVLLARQRDNGREVAIKLLPLNESFRFSHVEKEVLNHRLLRHPHVVEFRELILTNNHLGIVMEWCSGGTLFEFLKRSGRIYEPEARWFFQQLVLGLDYCHRTVGVVNRDVKLENLLLKPVGEYPTLKICDFGYSKHMTANSAPISRVGTSSYVAPEVLHCSARGEAYDGTKADIWSAGVVLYVLLVSRFPFTQGNNDVMCLRAISDLTQAKVDSILRQQIQYLSTGCLWMLARVLRVNPNERIGLREIIADPWFRECLPRGCDTLDPQQGAAIWRPQQSLEEVQHILQGAEHTAAINARAALDRQQGDPDLLDSYSDGVAAGESL